MRDSTIITHADVYNELPSTSSDKVTDRSLVFQAPRMFGGKKRFQPGRLFGKKDPSASKKHQAKLWMSMNKKRNEQQSPKRSEHQDDDLGVVMMSASSSPTMQSVPSAGYVELPDEPRPGKITPSTNSSPSPRASKADSPHAGHSSSPEVEEAIEEAVPIVRSTLPSPEPRPAVERNGYKEHDRVDAAVGLHKPKSPAQRDVDDDSCLIKCVYFTQQCCECRIV